MKNNNKSPKPFDCNYDPQFALLLDKLGISLAISTYQAGKIVFLSSVNEDKLVQLPRNYKTAMGMASADNKLAIAAENKVTVLHNRPELAENYAAGNNKYDGIYIPTATYNTGGIDLHDMEFIDDKLVAVNTKYSCLSYIDDNYSFTPFWQPPFITGMVPEDRCHLNGMAVENNEIKYVTALGKGNTEMQWREDKMNSGILMEYPSGKIIIDGLSMPHSPRIYNGKLYVLNSAKGELICVDTEKQTYEVVVKLGGFARGMSQHGDYLFIGVSKLRHNSAVFSDLEIAKTSFAGVVAVYLPYNSIAGRFEYEMTVDEIYDVKVLSNSTRPSILSPEMVDDNLNITYPGGALWQNKEEGSEKSENKNSTVNSKDENVEPEKFSFKLLSNIGIDKLLADFSPLIIPELKKNLRANTTYNTLHVLATINSKNQAVAITVFDVDENKEASILSIFVHNDMRNQKIAKNMVRQFNILIERNNINSIELSSEYSNKIAVKIMQSILVTN
ncbi:MAG: TIGR03032 family protein [Ichthyobacteriaceae bacterium]|nr:TIGR03032 family protein [Ichthyobacteriaceae bacterium]